MGKKINISIEVPYELDVELPEGKTIDDVLGLFMGGDWEIKLKEKDPELKDYSSIFVDKNDFERVGKWISRTEIYDYESKTWFKNNELYRNHIHKK